MRQSSKDLVHKYRDRLKDPVLDVGGGGHEAQWGFPYKVVDITDDADIKCDLIYEDIPIQAGTIICLDTLEHVTEPQRAIENMYDSLRKDGLLILTTVFAWGYHPHPDDYFRFSVPALEYLCQSFNKIESGWVRENTPFNDQGHLEYDYAGVYFVGKK